MIIACVCALLAQQPARDTRPADVNAPARISGVVTSDEAQPRPLRRALVTLNGGGLELPRVAITADNGAFAFDLLPAGRYTVAAAKDGYVAMGYGTTRPGRPGTGITLASRQAVAVTLRLPKGAVVTGTIFDVDGQPAAGIPVSALTRRIVSGPVAARYVVNGTPARAVTDDRGVYRIYGLPGGDYFVSAQPQMRPIVVAGNDARTASDGAVSRMLTQVFHPGATDAARATPVTVRPGEERSGIDISLQYVQLSTVSGMAPTGAGWTPALITLARTDEGFGYESVRSARADAAGAFSFAAVAPGQYRLVASSWRAAAAMGPGSSRISAAGEALTASADVIVTGEDAANLVLSVQPAPTISGRISFEGDRPAPALPEMPLNLPLSLTLADSGYPFPRAQIHADGTFRIEGVVPGVYRGFSPPQGVRTPIGSWWLKSIVSGGRDLLDAPLEMRQSLDDVVISFSDRTSEISGSVRDAQGVPAVECYVVAFSSERSALFPGSRRVAAVRPDRNGLYTIRNLPAGDYRIIAADLDPNEWMDSAVLDRLLALATAVRIAGNEKTTVDLTRR